MTPLLLVLSLLAASPTPASYAGHWALDKSKSTGLPPYYARIDSHRLAITQDERSLKVYVTIGFVGAAAPDTMRFDYALDGTPTKTETMIRTQNGPTPVPTTLEAKVTESGGVHIVIARSLQLPTGPFTGTTVEDWTLSADGRTLTVHRVDTTPRGEMQADFVFVKE